MRRTRPHHGCHDGAALASPTTVSLFSGVASTVEVRKPCIVLASHGFRTARGPALQSLRFDKNRSRLTDFIETAEAANCKKSHRRWRCRSA
jgi:hypothetical protein